MYLLDDQGREVLDTHEYIYFENDPTEYFRSRKINPSNLQLPRILQNHLFLLHANQTGDYGSVVSIDEKDFKTDCCADITTTLGSLRSWLRFDQNEDTFSIVCCDISNPLYNQVYTGISDSHGRVGLNDSKMDINEYILQRTNYEQLQCHGCQKIRSQYDPYWYTSQDFEEKCKDECTKEIFLCPCCIKSDGVLNSHSDHFLVDGTMWIKTSLQRKPFVCHIREYLHQSFDYG